MNIVTRPIQIFTDWHYPLMKSLRALRSKRSLKNSISGAIHIYLECWIWILIWTPNCYQPGQNWLWGFLGTWLHSELFVTSITSSARVNLFGVGWNSQELMLRNESWLLLSHQQRGGGFGQIGSFRPEAPCTLLQSSSSSSLGQSQPTAGKA